MKDVSEWAHEFDLAYQNINSYQAPGLNAYEKSVILTDAQDEIVIAIADGTLKPFESTEESTDFLATLVKQSDPLSPETGGSLPHIVDNSVVFKLPEDLLFRTYEKCTLSSVPGCSSNIEAVVVPVTQDEYWRTSRNPFKGANSRRVLRLSYACSSEDEGQITKDTYSELVGPKGRTIVDYTVRYISQPEPIILSGITGDVSIHGKPCSEPKTCMLPEFLHKTILNRAVQIAKALWAS